MADVLTFNGKDISSIPVINRPSYFLVNNFGRESYMTIMEPLEDFKRTADGVAEAGKYKSIKQLKEAFMSKAHVGNTEQGYNRKDTEEVSFMGFRWRWRPNHKSFYGAIPVGYELLPLIARWVVLTGALDKIDNHSADYLPARYGDGTGKGFVNIGIDTEFDNPTKEQISEDIEHTVSVAFSNTLTPIIHTLAGSVSRAAQMNIIPKEAFEMYDVMLQAVRVMGNGFRVDAGNKYVINWYENNLPVYAGAVFGGGKLPDWATLEKSREEGGFKVSLIRIEADSADHAESLMRSLLEK